MLFNSIDFIIFLPAVFLLYWFVSNKSLRLQNLFLLVASYFFYGVWDWRFLLLLAFISLTNYTIGRLIHGATKKSTKKTWLLTGVIANILVLSYFKYFNFFIDGFVNLFSVFGFFLEKPTLNIILPLGISFYIFLSISYITDIYRSKLNGDSRIIDVLLTLSFFPIILAGPIQRPILLLPQIQNKRIFIYTRASDGMRQILWGLFIKIVIADNFAVVVNDIFQNFNHYDGSTLLLGGIFYSIQIYADFAGYSEIAIGVAKLLGFELIRNFSYPYFAKDISEFWKRWHMSLTSWFRDYVFLPTAYFISRKIPSEKVLFIKTDLLIYIFSISITWFLTGLWHGANYTFLIWGAIHGGLLIVNHIFKKPRKRFLASIKVKNTNLILIGFERFFTLFFVVMAWIVFRSDNIANSFDYISRIFSSSLLTLPEIKLVKTTFLLQYSFFAIFFLIMEWFGRDHQYAIAQIGLKWKRPIRWSMYIFFIMIIYLGGNFNEQIEFIYFQF